MPPRKEEVQAAAKGAVAVALHPDQVLAEDLQILDQIVASVQCDRPNRERLELALARVTARCSVSVAQETP